VPGRNLFQLRKLKNWADTLDNKVLLMGDFNLPGSIPAMGSKWQSLILQNTYPSWLPKVQFDYILSKGVALKDVIQVPTTKSSISDHLPLTIEIN
jgi:endonuclease/exonuclease/phosphatase family metal-dependent hydrolase